MAILLRLCVFLGWSWGPQPHSEPTGTWWMLKQNWAFWGSNSFIIGKTWLPAFQKKFFFLRLIKKVPEASWTSNDSYKTIFWWVKCKWIRNMWIKFPLKYTGALKLRGKMFGKTGPDFYQTPNLWIRFGDSGLTEFSSTLTFAGNDQWLKGIILPSFSQTPCFTGDVSRTWLFSIWNSRHTSHLTSSTSYIQDLPIPTSLLWLTSSSSHGNKEKMSGRKRTARKDELQIHGLAAGENVSPQVRHRAG